MAPALATAIRQRRLRSRRRTLLESVWHPCLGPTCTRKPAPAASAPGGCALGRRRLVSRVSPVVDVPALRSSAALERGRLLTRERMLMPGKRTMSWFIAGDEWCRSDATPRAKRSPSNHGASARRRASLVAAPCQRAVTTWIGDRASVWPRRSSDSPLAALGHLAISCGWNDPASRKSIATISRIWPGRNPATCGTRLAERWACASPSPFTAALPWAARLCGKRTPHRPTRRSQQTLTAAAQDAGASHETLGMAASRSRALRTPPSPAASSEGGRAGTTWRLARHRPGDTARIGHVKAPDGARRSRSSHRCRPPGRFATGLVQDVDVTLEMFASPSARLRITRMLSADGVYCFASRTSPRSRPPSPSFRSPPSSRAASARRPDRGPRRTV